MKTDATFFSTKTKAFFWGVLTFLILFLVTQYAVRQRALAFKEGKQKELINAGNIAKEKLQASLKEASIVANTLSLIVKQYGVPHNFDSLAYKLLDNNKVVDALELIEGEKITHIYPLKGNETALGYNIFKDSLKRDEAFKAFNSHKMYFAGPLPLVQGDSAIIGRLPITINNKYFGFATVLIKPATLFNELELFAKANKDYILQVSKVSGLTGKETFFISPKDHSDTLNQVVFKIDEGNWNIYMGYRKQDSLVLPFIGGLFATAFSILGGFLVFYLLKQPIRLRQLVTEQTLLLEQSEKKFKNLVEQSGVGVFILQEGKHVYVNPRYAEIFGYAQEEIMHGINSEALVFQEDKHIYQQYLKDRTEQGKEFTHYEMRGVKKDDSIVWIQAYGSTTTYNGKFALIGSYVDITDRKNAEHEVKEKAIQLENISNNLPDVTLYQLVSDIDGENKFIYLSKGVEALTGISPAETLQKGHILYDMIHEDDRLKLIEAEKVSKQNMSLFNEQIRFYNYKGELRFLNIRSVPRKLEDGRIIWDGIYTDVTDIKEKELEVIKLNRFYQFISKINEAALQLETIENIFDQACKIAIHYGKFKFAGINFYDPKRNKITPASFALEDEKIPDESTSSKNISALAFSINLAYRAVQNKSYFCCNDIESDYNMMYWRDEALQKGYKSVLAIPIILSDEIFAVYTIYAAERFFFNTTEIQLLKDIVDDIALAVDKINSKALQQKYEKELKDSEALKTTMINSFPDKILRVRTDGTYIEAYSPEGVDFYLSTNEFIGKKITDLADPVFSKKLMHAIGEAAMSKQLVTMEDSVVINGKTSYVEIRIQHMLQDEVFMIVRDITDNKKAQAALKESEEKFRNLVEQNLVGVFIYQDHGFKYVNPGFEIITGYNKDQLLQNITLSDLISNEALPQIEQYFSLLLHEQKHTYQAVHKFKKPEDASYSSVEIFASKIIYKNYPAIIGLAIDITSRLEEEIRVGKAMITAQEKERFQIGMELHDNVNQLLSASLINIGFIKSFLEKIGNDGMMEKANGARKYIIEAVKELRQLSHQLAPSIDGEIIFKEKLELLIKDMDLEDKYAVRMHIDTNAINLSHDLQLALYRILQEQLTNIIKYSQATQIDIRLFYENGMLCFVVKDNGVGFDTQSYHPGIGLENIRRRAQLFGGSFEIISGLNQGCELSIKMPN